MTRAHLLLLSGVVAFGTMACDDKADDPTPDDTATDDTGATTALVFPQGSSQWTGTIEVIDSTTDAVLALSRSGGTLEGTVNLELMGTALAFTLVGTVDLQSGQVAMVPVAWVGEDPGLELVGFTAVYDAEAGTLVGTIRDTSSWDSPDLIGGPLSLSTSTEPTEVAAADLQAAPVVTEAGLSYAGTFQCLSDTRPLSGTLARGTDGQLTGTLTFTETDGSPVGTFPLLGAEDAASGSLTLVPLPWTEEEADSTNYANFFAHGTVSSTGFVGTVSQNIGMVCNTDMFNVSFE